MTELWNFEKFDKIPRLRRGLVITEKIDGTNGQVSIIDRREMPEKYLTPDPDSGLNLPFFSVSQDGEDYLMLAGSRNRWLTNAKQGDNYGFGRWVSDNRDELLQMGVGRHYGEWWGSGIQRGYGLQKDDKRFSLFNVARWSCEIPQRTPPACVGVVPILMRSENFSMDSIQIALDDLAINGSTAAPTFMKPEGIVIYMTQARRLFKITLENDGVAKSQVKGKAPNGGLKTSREWAKDFPLVSILDHDGWDRTNFEFSFNEELITRGEFRFRLNQSTLGEIAPAGSESAPTLDEITAIMKEGD